MDDRAIVISKKSDSKVEGGYKTFSVRIKENTARQLDEISAKSNRSRNELVNIFLEFVVSNCVIEE